MNTKTIEQYIQFAIENGLDIHQWVSEREKFKKWTKDFRINMHLNWFSLISNINNILLTSVNLIEFISSKEFAEAVARWLQKNKIWPVWI